MGKTEYLSSLDARMAVWRAALEGDEGAHAEEIRRLYSMVGRLLIDYQRCGAEAWREERRLLDTLRARLDQLVERSPATQASA